MRFPQSTDFSQITDSYRFKFLTASIRLLLISGLTTTVVDIPTPPLSLTHDDHILLVGSCFTDHIGSHLSDAGFTTLVNPFGTLYNPHTIALNLTLTKSNYCLCENDLVFHDGMWHSWFHSGHFSASDHDQCLSICNESYVSTSSYLQHCSTVVVTLGTAFVYYLLDSVDHHCRVVANCHRVPAEHFERKLLSVDECCNQLNLMANALEDKKIIFTLSPIRHMADTAHGNQLSKATLLLSIEQFLQARDDKERFHYFPAYELLLDELRDYRFYDRDLCHPSSLAIDIIWQRFQQTYFSNSTQNHCREAEKHHRQQQHRPIAANILK